MKLGDKLYRVNRDDRDHPVEEHDFLILELVGLFKLGSTQLAFFGNVRDLAKSPMEFLKQMHQENDDLIVRNQLSGEIIITKLENLEEIAKKISEKTRNVYVRKEDAREEIKDLLSGQLKELQRREKSLQESIAKISESLQEL